MAGGAEHPVLGLAIFHTVYILIGAVAMIPLTPPMIRII